MNEPVRKKSGRVAAKPKPMSGSADADAGSATQRRGGAGRSAETADALARLTSERDGLQAALASAQARIADLERRQAEVLDRIDWAIDSLSTILASHDTDGDASVDL